MSPTGQEWAGWALLAVMVLNLVVQVITLSGWHIALAVANVVWPVLLILGARRQQRAQAKKNSE